MDDKFWEFSSNGESHGKPQLTCSSCGAPLFIEPDADQDEVMCKECGAWTDISPELPQSNRLGQQMESSELALPVGETEVALVVLDEAGRLAGRMKRVPESAPHIMKLQQRFTNEVGPMADWKNKSTTADDVYNKVLEIWREASEQGGISEDNYNEFIKNLDAIRAEWAADPNHEYLHGFGKGLGRTEFHTEKEHLGSFPSLWITSGTVGSSRRLDPGALVTSHLKPEPYKEEFDPIAALANDVPDNIWDTWLMTEQLDEEGDNDDETEKVDRDQAEKDILGAIDLLQKRLTALSTEDDFDNIKKDVVDKLQEFLK